MMQLSRSPSARWSNSAITEESTPPDRPQMTLPRSPTWPRISSTASSTNEPIDQSPRQRLASVGYAYMASGLVPGTDVSGSVTTGTEAAIKGTNTATAGDAYGVYGETTTTTPRP